MPAAESNKKSGSRRATRKPRLKDNEAGKKYPYSIKATMHEIRGTWYHPDYDRVDTTEEFCKSAETITNLLRDRYKGNRSIDPVGRLERIFSSNQSLDYFDIRLFAECARVPTGIFHLFTHVLGDIARDGDFDNAVNLIDSSINALNALRDYVIEHRGELPLAFRTPHHAENPISTYDANLNGLRAASKAFGRSRVPPINPEPVSLIW